MRRRIVLAVMALGVAACRRPSARLRTDRDASPRSDRHLRGDWREDGYTKQLVASLLLISLLSACGDQGVDPASGTTTSTTATVLDDELCTADALVIDGRLYGRDVDQNCQFVDEHGKVIAEP